MAQEHVQLHGETISAAPADVGQITEILRFAHASQLAVAPSGGGTKLGWGNPVSADIQLNLHRLDSLRDHPWQDMTCTVEAGCPWADLQTQLRRHGQMVALDPLWPDRATVGGIVACNDSGALRLKYGGLRDLIIGMTVVLADGTIAKSGGKVVKNVAGYDIHKLMTGSFGTLGVITEVNFRLHPVEEHARTWTAVAAGASAFAAPLKALLDSQMTPSGIQIRTSSRQCALDIRIAGVASCLDEYGERLQSTLRANHSVPRQTKQPGSAASSCSTARIHWCSSSPSIPATFARPARRCSSGRRPANSIWPPSPRRRAWSRLP